MVMTDMEFSMLASLTWSTVCCMLSAVKIALGGKRGRIFAAVCTSVVGILWVEWCAQILGYMSEPCGVDIHPGILEAYSLGESSERCWRSDECVIMGYGVWGCKGVTAIVTRMSLGGAVLLAMALI